MSIATTITGPVNRGAAWLTLAGIVPTEPPETADRIDLYRSKWGFMYRALSREGNVRTSYRTWSGGSFALLSEWAGEGASVDVDARGTVWSLHLKDGAAFWRNVTAGTETMMFDAAVVDHARDDAGSRVMMVYWIGGGFYSRVYDALNNLLAGPTVIATADEASISVQPLPDGGWEVSYIAGGSVVRKVSSDGASWS